MIHIETIRCGLIWVAVTINDWGKLTVAVGLTEYAARRNLLRKLE